MPSLKTSATTGHIDIVMTRPPGPDSDFVEVEDQDGAGMKAGEWVHREDGFWVLRIPTEAPKVDLTDEHLLLCSHGAVLCFRCLNEAIVDAMHAGILSTH